MPFFTRPKDNPPICFSAHFAVNDPIRVESGGRFYASRVEDMDAETLCIAWPTLHGTELRAEPDELVILISSRRTGMQGYRARVLESDRSASPLLRAAPMEALGRVQRRDFARVPDFLPVRFRILDRETLRTTELVEVHTKNISGGGLLLAVPHASRPETGDLLHLELCLPGLEPVFAQAEVMWVQPVEGGSGVWEMAARFTAILEPDRRLVIRRVFSREAELRHVGLL